MLLRSRQDLTLDGQDLRRLAQGRLDIARDLRHRCDEEVAEGVAGKLALAFEAILEELLHQRLGIGQRDETVAQVARRDDAEVLAQPAGRAAVIGDRHDSRDVRGRSLDAAQEHGEAVAAANDGDVRPLAEAALLVDDVDEALRIIRQEHRDDRADDEARRDQHKPDAHDDDRDACQRRERVIVAALPEVDRAEDRLLDDIEVLVVEDECEPEADEHDADREEQQPSLEFHARVEPFQKMHAQHSSRTCSRTSFFMRSRCSSRVE